MRDGETEIIAVNLIQVHSLITGHTVPKSQKRPQMELRIT